VIVLSLVLVIVAAVLLVVGDVEAVYGPEWSTSDGSRPRTPWDVSDVPEEIWIHTPILIELAGLPVVLRSVVAAELETALPQENLILALRGGEIGDDRYEIIDGQNREFEPEEQVALLLSVKDEDLDDPELIETTFGEGWEFLARYEIDNDTAILQWGDESYEYALEELIEEFDQAAD
jgi:hypothetical protein